MARRSTLTLAAGFALLALLLPLGAAIGAELAKNAAADTPMKPAPESASENANAPAVDPDAIEALIAMSTDLRKLTTFGLHADGTSELVLEDGQKVQFQGKVDIKVQRPDKFAVTMRSERKTRDVFYNGKSVTLFDPKLGFYADFPAPGTIAETINKAQDTYGLTLPLADLFSFEKDDPITKSAKSGFVVGNETINGTPCVHYAFRQENVDWQIWIASEGPAYPAKLVITATDDPSMPQYVAYLTWKTDLKVSNADFTFKPGPKDVNISIAKVADATPAPAKQ